MISLAENRQYKRSLMSICLKVIPIQKENKKNLISAAIKLTLRMFLDRNYSNLRIILQ